jgi:hypothetical protein
VRRTGSRIGGHVHFAHGFLRLHCGEAGAARAHAPERVDGVFVKMIEVDA